MKPVSFCYTFYIHIAMQSALQADSLEVVRKYTRGPPVVAEHAHLQQGK